MPDSNEDKISFDKEIFYFSLSPSNWINPIRNIEEISNIFTMSKDALIKEKYFKDDKFLLDIEYLKESLIILDGYDEAYLTLEESKITVYDFFKKLVNLSKKWNSKFIVTSRKTCIDDTVLDNLHNDIYENDEEDIIKENKVQICRLAVLTEQQQKDWINLKYNKLFPNNKYDIEEMYPNSKKSKILELLKIPLLLQLIVSEHFYYDAKNIVELYDKLFEEILDTRKEVTKNDKGHFKKIFESFAYSIYKNNDQYAFVKSKKLEINENEKMEAVLLFYIKNEKNQKRHYIEFIHRTFYQYFQAYYFYHLVLTISKKIYKIELDSVDNSLS